MFKERSLASDILGRGKGTARRQPELRVTRRAGLQLLWGLHFTVEFGRVPDAFGADPPEIVRSAANGATVRVGHQAAVAARVPFPCKLVNDFPIRSPFEHGSECAVPGANPPSGRPPWIHRGHQREEGKT